MNNNEILKQSLQLLRTIDPTQDDFVNTFIIKTANFTKIQPCLCERLISNVFKMIAAYGLIENEEVA